jgi:hypothetical protein
MDVGITWEYGNRTGFSRQSALKLDSREQIKDLEVEIEGGRDTGCPVCQPHRGKPTFGQRA